MWSAHEQTTIHRVFPLYLQRCKKQGTIFVDDCLLKMLEIYDNNIGKYIINYSNMSKRKIEVLKIVKEGTGND